MYLNIRKNLAHLGSISVFVESQRLVRNLHSAGGWGCAQPARAPSYLERGEAGRKAMPPGIPWKNAGWWLQDVSRLYASCMPESTQAGKWM